MWIMNIVDLVKSKNNRIKLIKVKSHSDDKWNDRADTLAKKGVAQKMAISIEKIKCNRIEYHLE